MAPSYTSKGTSRIVRQPILPFSVKLADLNQEKTMFVLPKAVIISGKNQMFINPTFLVRGYANMTSA